MAAQALQTGIPGEIIRKDIVRFTNAGSAAHRYEVAREFAGTVNETCFVPHVQGCSRMLQEDDSVVPHQSSRDSDWVEFMMNYNLSEEELELIKRIYAYSQRTCAFCGSDSAPLRNCSLCIELGYCIGTECQHDVWNKTPAAESHKVLCPRFFVRGSKGRTRRAD